MGRNDWIEAAGYDMADKFVELLTRAYEAGVSDAWNAAKELYDSGTFSTAWDAKEMMTYYEKNQKSIEEVKKLADQMGIHALYAAVRELRGEVDA